jgi:hypothetical protein
MRKLFAAFLVFLMVFSSSAVMAESVDLSAMTADELVSLIDDARLELSKYLPVVADGVVLYEDENIKITLNGEISIEYGDLVVPVIIQNYTDRNLLIGLNNASCNGWDIMEGSLSVNASKKAKDEITFYSAEEDADLTSVDDVEDITCTIRYFDDDDWDYSVESDEPVIWLFAK